MICRICPRACGVNRPDSREAAVGLGRCRMGRWPVVARAAAHFGEEPCISGTRGSGTVFFSGCSLGCVYCQNGKISQQNFGKEISPSRLRDIFFELIEQGVHNINLVNPSHFAESIAEALEEPLPVPVVYNTSGYERVETLKLLEGKIQVYLPDYKYALSKPAARYSLAADYPATAASAIYEMFRQCGSYRLDDEGILQQGVLIRHLVLPANLANTYAVIDWLNRHFKKGEVLFSLMGQYTPCGNLANFPELQRSLTQEEYQRAEEYLLASGWEDGYLQEPEAAGTEAIPEFDLTGVNPDWQ